MEIPSSLEQNQSRENRSALTHFQGLKRRTLEFFSAFGFYQELSQISLDRQEFWAQDNATLDAMVKLENDLSKKGLDLGRVISRVVSLSYKGVKVSPGIARLGFELYRDNFKERGGGLIPPEMEREYKNRAKNEGLDPKDLKTVIDVLRFTHYLDKDI